MQESFETPNRLGVGIPPWTSKILTEMEGKAGQVCGQKKRKDQKGRTQGLSVERKPIWQEIKIHEGKLLKSGSKGGLDSDYGWSRGSC